MSYDLASFLEHKGFQSIDHHRAVASSTNVWFLPHCKGKYIEDQGILGGPEESECGTTNHLIAIRLLISGIQEQDYGLLYLRSSMIL